MIDTQAAMAAIQEERGRQYEEEGKSKEGDAKLVEAQLLKAAQCYYHWAMGKDLKVSSSGAPEEWPFDQSSWKPKTKLRDLIRAGALALAERDRLVFEDAPTAMFKIHSVDTLLGFVVKAMTALDLPAMAQERPRKVPERLTALGDIYRDRNAVYGDTYKNFGRVMAGFFPQPVALQTPEEWNRMALFFHAADKLARYAGSFFRGGHVDSLDDLSVYSQMLQEFDADLKEEKRLPAIDTEARGG